MNKNMKIIGFGIVSIFLIISSLNIHKFGIPENSDMDDYFIMNAQKEVAANNVVTSVVFDYRGLDTLGEATILFTAVNGVGLLFKKFKKNEERK